MGSILKINVKIRVFRKNIVYGYSNEILKYSQCVELSFFQVDHNSENVSELEMYTSFIVLNEVLRVWSYTYRMTKF